MLSISLIIIISLCGAFSSVFPVALYNFGMEQRSIWSISSLIGGAFWTYGFFYTLRRLRLDRVGQVSRITFVILMALVIVAAATNFMNAFGIVFDQEYGPFFAAFIFGYGLVLYNFSLLLLHPLWKKIHDQETEAPG
ncbi:MAG: hypothetical protein HKN70_08520 [Gammaproteobacteria bacterium]|nr:hypothetical protein [Gammaproteobacteria bacterium]